MRAKSKPLSPKKKLELSPKRATDVVIKGGHGLRKRAQAHTTGTARKSIQAYKYTQNDDDDIVKTTNALFEDFLSDNVDTTIIKQSIIECGLINY
jgi:hypothetical protein